MNARRRAVVVTHSRLRNSGTVVSEAVDQLRRAGFDVSIIDNLEAPDFSVRPTVVDTDTEFVLVLGGDGTILRAAELVHCTQVPILGINMGHVGFLAEFESFQLSEAISKVAAHEYSIDERMIAHVDVWLPGEDQPLQDWALNDVTLMHEDLDRMVELSVRVDDVEMNSFGCDGVIVSTPTGSTAYAFSAGGPVIWPNVKALQLVPLAAHALFSRPLIVGAGSTFELDVLEQSATSGVVSCDGRRKCQLPQGSRVQIRESKDTLQLVRLSDAPFTERLVTKFDLPVIGWREHVRSQTPEVQRANGVKYVQGRECRSYMSGAHPDTSEASGEFSPNQSDGGQPHVEEQGAENSHA